MAQCALPVFGGGKRSAPGVAFTSSGTNLSVSPHDCFGDWRVRPPAGYANGFLTVSVFFSTTVSGSFFSASSALTMPPMSVCNSLASVRPALSLGCQRRLNIDPPCRSNIDPGRVAGF